MAFLKIFDGGGERTVFLGDAPVVLGRGEEADVTLRDVKVSRRHCAVEPAGPGRWKVRDLESGNGTRLNGEKVHEKRLRPEDVIQIGDVRILFAAEAAAMATPAVRAARPKSIVPWVAGGVAAAAALALFLVSSRSRAPERGDEPATTRVVARDEKPPFDAAAAVAGLDRDAAIRELERLSKEGPSEHRPAVADLLSRLCDERDAERERFFAALEADFDGLVEKGEYARAREMWFFLRDQPGWVPMPEPYRRRVVEAMLRLENAAAAERGRIFEDVARAEAARDFETARALLAEAMPRFSGTSVARSFVERLEGVRAAARVPGAAAETVVPAAVETRVAAALARLPERRFAEAAAELREIAAGTTVPRVRTEVEARANECAAAAALFQAAQAALADGWRPSGLIDKRWRVLGGGSEGLHVKERGEERTPAWADVPDALYLGLLERVAERAPGGGLGLAVTAGALSSGARLHESLAVAYADEAARAAIDRFVAARVRREPLPEGGYVVAAGELLTRREFVRREEEQRIRALQEQLDSALAAIRKDPAFARLEKLQERKDALDDARQHALELIFDEQKYFYPYRGVGRDAEYARVQEEVDHRVEAVRELWEDAAVVTVPETTSLRRQLTRFDEAAEELEKRLVDVSGPVDEVAWLRSYLGKRFTVRDFYRTPQEKALLEYSVEVMADNAKVAPDISVAGYEPPERLAGPVTEVEREQVRITNEYRMMFGRWPVRLVVDLVLSSREHCEEMVRLGYFGHFSPTPGRRTPYDRMKLVGYQYGASENLCMGRSSAQAAHDAWCHSSGHHRNLLVPEWTEMGTGHYGTMMAQNFGRAPRHWAGQEAEQERRRREWEREDGGPVPGEDLDLYGDEDAPETKEGELGFDYEDEPGEAEGER